MKHVKLAECTIVKDHVFTSHSLELIHVWKINMERNHGGLEDQFPFQFHINLPGCNLLDDLE